MTNEIRTKCCNAKIRLELVLSIGDSIRRCDNCLLLVCSWCGGMEHQGAPADCGKVNVNSMTVTEKIKAGDYESKLPFQTGLNYDRYIRKAWREDTDHLSMVVFKADLLEENGLTSHPKADKLFDMAWEDGHSSGLEEVEAYFVEFMVLLK